MSAYQNSFLNDRVTVTVGNNFNLEGQNQPGQKTTDIAGNVSVNYKLTKDGRYMVRAYRRDEFIVVEGEVIETGVGFTLTYDYNHFKELFCEKDQRRIKHWKRNINKNKKKKKNRKQLIKGGFDAAGQLQCSSQKQNIKLTMAKHLRYLLFISIIFKRLQHNQISGARPKAVHRRRGKNYRYKEILTKAMQRA